MAQEYMAIRQDQNGIIALSTNVFSSVVKICVEEDKNVRLVDGGRFKDIIESKVEDGKLKVSFHVNINYNVNVQEVCANLQHKIYDNIKHMCEIEPSEVDIKISGFDF